MIELVSDKIEEISGICHKLAVHRLYVFGSAVSGAFDVVKSDVDFVVEFSEHSKPGILDRYLNLADGLEVVLRRRVDLVTKESIRNPYFLKEVDATKEVVYES
jgi:predicted nucleotidyltransferase